MHLRYLLRDFKAESMQRVRKFLIAKESSAIGRVPAASTLRTAVATEGWHKSWDTAVEMMLDATAEQAGTAESDVFVVIADQEVAVTVAIFGLQNLESLESLEPQPGASKWRSIRIARGAGFWCNFNYSDYGWGWVSGAEREVPFRLRYLERKTESNPDSLISRGFTWVLEFRDWMQGRKRKIS